MAKALPYLAVGRVRDTTTLASCSFIDVEEQRTKTEDIFKKLLAAAQQKLKPGQRTRLQWNDGSVCCLMDQQGEYLYCVVNSFMEYPEHYAYQLLQECLAAVQKIPTDTLRSAKEGGLSEVMKPKMVQLMAKYEEPTNFDHEKPKLSPNVSEARGLKNDEPPPNACPCCCSVQ
mmetsp:Transcript_86399/g.241698  ORF Transcript_86399/g.241698 Transcript_86399/m.241698 type:complete len:173 (-) Transcript_86399:96-614(-)